MNEEGVKKATEYLNGDKKDVLIEMVIEIINFIEHVAKFGGKEDLHYLKTATIIIAEYLDYIGRFFK